VRKVLSLLIVPAMLAFATGARAERASARVEYLIDATVTRCPDERAMRGLVVSRLGYDPFDGRPGLAISARIARVGTKLHGQLEIREADGRVLGTRDLTSVADDCAELAQTMAFAIAIAIDPRANAAPPGQSDGSSRTPTPPVASDAIPANPPQQAPMDQAPTPRIEPAPAGGPHVRVGGGGDMTAGTLPSTPAWGLFAFGSLRWSRFSVELAGAGFFPGSTATERGTVTAWLLLATAGGCWHVDPWFACPRASVGMLHGSANVQKPQPQSTPYMQLGAQLGLELPFAPSWLARFSGHLDTPLSPTHLEIDGTSVWTTPRLNGGFAATVMGDFF